MSNVPKSVLFSKLHGFIISLLHISAVWIVFFSFQIEPNSYRRSKVTSSKYLLNK